MLGMRLIGWRREKIFQRWKKREIFETQMSVETGKHRICIPRIQTMGVCVCLQLVFIPLSGNNLVLY